MDEKSIWILFNSISIVLSLLMIKGTSEKLYKAIGILFALTFFLILCGHFGIKSPWLHPLIILTMAFISFVVKIFKSHKIPIVHRVFLMIHPGATILKLYFGALYLNGYTQIRLISIGILILSVLYFISVILFRKKFEIHKEAFETNGLFAVILLSTLFR